MHPHRMTPWLVPWRFLLAKKATESGDSPLTRRSVDFARTCLWHGCFPPLASVDCFCDTLMCDSPRSAEFDEINQLLDCGRYKANSVVTKLLPVFMAGS